MAQVDLAEMTGAKLAPDLQIAPAAKRLARGSRWAGRGLLVGPFLGAGLRRRRERLFGTLGVGRLEQGLNRRS